MKKLLTVLLALLIILALTGCSQRAKYVVGVCQLAPHDALDAATQGFVDTLKAEFGDDINIIVKNAEGASDQCTTIVSGFVADGVDLIMANATAALQAAAAATNTIPVLGTSITEYGVALSLKDFSGVVGTNVSGTSDLASLVDQGQMFIDLLPNAKTVGLLYCRNEANSIYQVKAMKEFLEENGIVVKEFSFSDTSDIIQVTQSACDNCDALFIPTDNVAANCADTINNVTSVAKIPVITGEKAVCAKCGVASLSIDYYSLGVTTAKMAIEILKGDGNVKDMAIRYDENPTYVYNSNIAKALGIEIPSHYVDCK